MKKNTFNECLKYKTKKTLSNPIFFYHVPKSGGTTFCDLFGSVFEKSLRIAGTLFSNNDKGGITAFENFSNNKSKYLDIFGKAEFVYGHLPFAIHKYIEKNFTTITIVREPMERAVSHYLWAIVRGYIKKNDDINKLFKTNKLPSNPLCNQFALNTKNQQKIININLIIENMRKINYLCKLDDIFNLIKLIISQYDKSNVLFQNRQINLKKEILSQNKIETIKKYNVLDINLYGELVKQDSFFKFNNPINNKTEDNYIYLSTKEGVLIDNKNMAHLKKHQIDIVKNNLIVAGYKIVTY